MCLLGRCLATSSQKFRPHTPSRAAQNITFIPVAFVFSFFLSPNAGSRTLRRPRSPPFPRRASPPCRPPLPSLPRRASPPAACCAVALLPPRSLFFSPAPSDPSSCLGRRAVRQTARHFRCFRRSVQGRPRDCCPARGFRPLRLGALVVAGVRRPPFPAGSSGPELLSLCVPPSSSVDYGSDLRRHGRLQHFPGLRDGPPAVIGFAKVPFPLIDSIIRALFNFGGHPYREHSAFC